MSGNVSVCYSLQGRDTDVAAERRPEGCGTSFHMQGILSASPNANDPATKGLDVDYQKNALLTSSQ